MAAVSEGPTPSLPTSYTSKWPSPTRLDCIRPRDRREVSTPSPKSEPCRSQSRASSRPSPPSRYPPTPWAPIPEPDPAIKGAEEPRNRSTSREASAERHGKLAAGHETSPPPPPAAPQLRPKSLRLRGIAPPRSSGEEERVKMQIPRLSVSLSLEEIEEDVWAFTGSRPSRRPKKRARHVQRKLDQSFPGLWLSKITNDRYRIPAHFDSRKEVESARRFLKLC